MPEPPPESHTLVSFARFSYSAVLTSDQSDFVFDIEDFTELEIRIVVRAGIVGGHVVFCLVRSGSGKLSFELLETLVWKIVAILEHWSSRA